jgi:(E)-2-((N-methylformamido)methylene)succinate hydrolase
VKQLSLNGTVIEISGSGPPVVFLHGVGLNQAIWAEQVRALSANYQIITYDLLGHGKSIGVVVNSQLAEWVGQLERVVRDLALGSFSLVGFSFGGMIAQGYASKHSGMIDKLVLMSTVYDRSESERAGVLARLELAKREGPQAIIPAALARWFSPDAQPDLPAYYNALLRGNDAASFLSAYECFAKSDTELRGALKNFSRPTLVMTGELDTGSTPEMARKLARVIPAAECSIVPQGRHMMPVEMPGEVNSVLRRFLEGENL